jgi:ATP-binding cassette, subfamily A (ABC1), member 3
MMCLGSSLFLKKRFGAGYKLTMVKAEKRKNELILPYLLEHLGQAEIIQEVSSDISFGVPVEVEEKFANFFE